MLRNHCDSFPLSGFNITPGPLEAPLSTSVKPVISTSAGSQKTVNGQIVLQLGHVKWCFEASKYHLPKKDCVLTKSLWASNFRICHGLPAKICASSAFECVMQPNSSGGQALGRANVQVMNVGSM